MENPWTFFLLLSKWEFKFICNHEAGNNICKIILCRMDISLEYSMLPLQMWVVQKSTTWPWELNLNSFVLQINASVVIAFDGKLNLNSGRHHYYRWSSNPKSANYRNIYYSFILVSDYLTRISRVLCNRKFYLLLWIGSKRNFFYVQC